MSNLIYRHILFIGPNYKNHKGGIGAVLSVYRNNINDFNFIDSYDGNNGNVGNLFLFARALVKLFWILLTNRNIKIVHIHGASKGSFYRKYVLFLLSKYIFGKKIIYHLHGGKFHIFYNNSKRFLKWCIRHLIRKSDHIICLSEYWRTFFIETFNTKSVSIIKNIIDKPLLISADDHKNDYISFLFLGLIGDNKGIFDLLELIAEKYQYFNSKIRLIIGGNGEIDRLNQFIKQNHLEKVVRFDGWVDGDSKHRLLKQCDVLILPSYNEGLPISILEAMSYGKAILSTSVGSIPEVIKNGINGFLIAPGSKTELYEAINSFILDFHYKKKFSAQNLLDIKEYYPDKAIINLTKIYETLVDPK